jgi:hypothetical protein
MSHFRRIRILVVAVLATASVLALLGAGVYSTWNAHQRPSTISGVWLLDDLRTSGDDASVVVFSTSGVFVGDPKFGSRWRYQAGRLYFRTWKIDGHSPLMNAVQDTAIYSWFAEAQEFSLGVELSEDGTVMTLTADGEGPRCRLRRSGR